MSAKKRTPGQLLADEELNPFMFALMSVERGYVRPKDDCDYIWRFQSIGRRYTAYVTIRTLNPGLFRFDEEYSWKELRRYKAHVHDYGKLNTRM